ncbi:aldehyde dehydrogenase [Patescibacteria group bacterium]|nr:MAG: aldehyde dehydrogenase [Patescibacteria group bacterium]
MFSVKKMIASARYSLTDHPIIIRSDELLVSYGELNVQERKAVQKILLEHGFETERLERMGMFRVPRFLMVGSRKVDLAKMIGPVVNINYPHQQSKCVRVSFPERIDVQNMLTHSRSFADFIEAHRQEIVKVLTNYETHAVANDEIERAVDLFRSLDENAIYYQRKVKDIVSFTPRNQPLYALGCFALVLAYMARSVYVHVPSVMKSFFPRLEEVLELKRFFPNVLVSYEQRNKLIERCSKLKYDQTLDLWRSETDVVIFTGNPWNAKRVKNEFDKDTLFIANGAGHNPVVVTPEADIEKAVAAVVDLQLYNQGQDCANPCTVLVHQAIHEVFAAKLLQAVKDVQVGPYSDQRCIVGPITKIGDLKRIQDILIENSRWIHPETPGIIHVATRTVEPTILVKPLMAGGNYVEQLSPLLFVQQYSSDNELAEYFENQQYWQNAMYVTVYGQSDYVDGLLDYRLSNDSILHDEATILRNTHLHAKGVERGTKPYGGYGREASWIERQNTIIAKPTLPPRDIFEQLIAPSLELDLVGEIFREHHASG